MIFFKKPFISSFFACLILAAAVLLFQKSSPDESPSGIKNVTIAGDSSNSSIKIMPLGDSITESSDYRVSLWNKLSGEGYAIDYVGSLSKPHPTLPDTDHEGHSGWYIEQISGKVNRWLETYQPDYVLLMIGTNDVAWWNARKVEETAAAHDALIGKILSQLPSGSHLLAASIPPQIDDKNSEGQPETIKPNGYLRSEFTKTFNREIEARINIRMDKGEPVTFVDIFSIMNPEKHISKDNIHPNSAGYKAIGQAWFEALLPMLEQRRDNL